MRAIKQFSKENPSLAAGIFLPLLLVIMFSLAAAIPQWMVAPPQYDVLYTTDVSQPNIRVDVVNGELKGRMLMRAKTAMYANNRRPSVYRYDTKTESLRQIEFDAPANDEAKQNEWVDFDLPEELRTLRINTGSTSPDGYVFNTHNGYENSVSLFYRTARNEILLSKQGRNIRITPTSTANYFGTPKFIGWVVPEGQTR